MNHRQPEGKRLLLVEGPDDEHVVKNICGRHALGKIDKVHHGKTATESTAATQGKQALLQSLPQHLKGSDLHSVGLILDADENLAGSWLSVRQILTDSGYLNVPPQPAPNGTVVAPPPEPTLLPRVGIWIMPDNQICGTLENFLHFLVPDSDLLLPYAKHAIQALPECRFTERAAPKALMHTWLAWQKEPGKPYGQAILARYLDTDLPAGQRFVRWLQRTFFD